VAIDRIPLKRDGGLWRIAPAEDHPNLVWSEALNFEADMKLVSYQRTRHGDFYLWADEATNATYPMSASELYSALLISMPEDGHLSGLWAVIQSGQKFSLRLIEELED
jgi:hypothetical protein